jgi:hypothetical protein
MPIQGLDISLNVKNNTNYPQQINVMGNPANLLDTANATTEYRYNLTGFSLTYETSVSIQYRNVNDASFSTFTYLLENTDSLNSVVFALNNLAIGYFNLYDELGQTYIGTYNQNYVFGDLNVYGPTTTTTTTTTTTSTTTTTTTAAPTTSTTTTTTTAAPTTSTTTTTTTAAPTTSTTTTTTTLLPPPPTTTTTTSTTTTTTTLAPTTTSTTTTTTTIAAFSGTVLIGNNASDACNNPISSFTASGNNTTFCNSTQFISIGFQSYGDGSYFISDGINTLTITISGSPTSVANVFGGPCASCPPPPSPTTTTTSTTTSTTTAAPASFNLSSSLISGQDACVEYPITITYYAAPGSPLTNNTVLYYDSALATLANDGWYSDGNNNWQISGGNGTLINQTACLPVTNWSWYNNNTVETPPYGGGYITIDVNGINVVTQFDTTSSSPITYDGFINISIGDTISIYVYSYPNNSYGTQTILSVENPIGTVIYNANDTQVNPGSPSSETFTFSVTAPIMSIVASSNSY